MTNTIMDGLESELAKKLKLGDKDRCFQSLKECRTVLVSRQFVIILQNRLLDILLINTHELHINQQVGYGM